MSANNQGIFSVTGRAHCQRQVAFFLACSVCTLTVCNSDMPILRVLTLQIVQVETEMPCDQWCARFDMDSWLEMLYPDIAIIGSKKKM